MTGPFREHEGAVEPIHDPGSREICTLRLCSLLYGRNGALDVRGVPATSLCARDTFEVPIGIVIAELSLCRSPCLLSSKQTNQHMVALTGGRGER